MSLPNWSEITNLNWKIAESFSGSHFVGPKEIFFEAVSLKNSDGIEICVAGIDENSELAQWKAFGEAIERAIVFKKLFSSCDKTEHYRSGISNGVAAFGDVDSAKLRAKFELYERDAILKSWHGEIPAPLQIEFHAPYLPSGYKCDTFLIAEAKDPETTVYTAAVFFAPHSNEKPFIYGFGSAPTLGEAKASAFREAIQRYIFLKDETGFDVEINFQATPGYHQDFYLQTRNHHNIRAWLEQDGLNITPQIEYESVAQIEVLSRSPLFVARATQQQCWPLYFGNYDYKKGPNYRVKSQPHPIP